MKKYTELNVIPALHHAEEESGSSDDDCNDPDYILQAEESSGESDSPTRGTPISTKELPVAST